MYSVSHLEEYDLVILGDGTGSTLAAWTFASQGQRVAVIQCKYIGGSVELGKQLITFKGAARLRGVVRGQI